MIKKKISEIICTPRLACHKVDSVEPEGSGTTNPPTSKSGLF